AGFRPAQSHPVERLIVMRRRHRPDDGNQVLVMEKDRPALLLALLGIGLGKLRRERAELTEPLGEVLRLVMPVVSHVRQFTTARPAGRKQARYSLQPWSFPQATVRSSIPS